MALFLSGVHSYIHRKMDGSTCMLYDLFCIDDYDDGKWLCGSTRVKVITCTEYILRRALGDDFFKLLPEQEGKRVYTNYNENGLISYIRFLDPVPPSSASASAPSGIS